MMYFKKKSTLSANEEDVFHHLTSEPKCFLPQDQSEKRKSAVFELQGILVKTYIRVYY